MNVLKEYKTKEILKRKYFFFILNWRHLAAKEQTPPQPHKNLSTLKRNYPSVFIFWGETGCNINANEEIMLLPNLVARYCREIKIKILKKKKGCSDCLYYPRSLLMAKWLMLFLVIFLLKWNKVLFFSFFFFYGLRLISDRLSRWIRLIFLLPFYYFFFIARCKR